MIARIASLFACVLFIGCATTGTGQGTGDEGPMTSARSTGSVGFGAGRASDGEPGRGSGTEAAVSPASAPGSPCSSWGWSCGTVAPPSRWASSWVTRPPCTLKRRPTGASDKFSLPGPPLRRSQAESRRIWRSSSRVSVIGLPFMELPFMAASTTAS